MATTITCGQCGDERRAAYKNTTHCIRCALLRDLTFVGDRRYACDVCDRDFAPVAVRDKHCGVCAVGCGKYTPCAICAANPDETDEDGYYELHRAGVALCIRCVRDPRCREKVIRALRKGRAASRTKNGLAPQGGKVKPPRPAGPPLNLDAAASALLKQVKRAHPKLSSAESNHAYVVRLAEAGVLTIDEKGTIANA